MKYLRRSKLTCTLAVAAFLTMTMGAQTDLPPSLPSTPWKLSPREWKPTGVTESEMLDVLERGTRAVATLQAENGAIIDPYKKREFQYSTPYFAHAVGLLLQRGRAPELKSAGVKAMEHATRQFAEGAAAIPDRHGEFYIPALAEALELYHGIVPTATSDQWRQRLRTPILQVIDGYREHTNNWRTYAMRGEWLRARAGLADPKAAIDFIERSWHDFQLARVAESKWNLYLDFSSDPNSQAVEAVGRGNLLGLMAAGYNGRSVSGMRAMLNRATQTSLLAMDPTGQAPPNGRTDDHVWNDILYQLCFEMAAEDAWKRGERELASQYRRAASLAFRSAIRWQRPDGAFQITKNFFPNERRVGYQPASQWTNYNGAALIHLAEAIHTRRTEIPEEATPAEIGGYAFTNDRTFATAFANAGGMQLMANLRGEVDPAKYNIYWTPIGIARFSRAAWDSRLGPPDGVRDSHSREGVSFGPVWNEGPQWVELADLPERYQGSFEVTFANPALVQCRLRYTPKRGGGPVFTLHMTVTPDGVLVRADSDRDLEFGLTLPLLEDDGSGQVDATVTPKIATTSFHAGGAETHDEQTFLALDGSSPIDASHDAVESPVGWIRPLRTDAKTVFVYPRSPDDSSAEEVLRSFRLSADGMESILGRVEGRLYVGRFSAGGEAMELRLTPGGEAVVVFPEKVSFVARHANGEITALETDRDTTARVNGNRVEMRAHTVWRAP